MSQVAPTRPRPSTEMDVAARAENATKVYGTGDTAVTAPDDVTVKFGRGAGGNSDSAWFGTVVGAVGLVDRLIPPDLTAEQVLDRIKALGG